MKAKTGANRAAASRPVDEADIFADPFLCLPGSVAPGSLVAQRATQTDFAIRPLNQVQAAGAGVRTRVVIEQSAGAALRGIDQTGQGAVVYIIFIEFPVQTPPEFLEDFSEVP